MASGAAEGSRAGEYPSASRKNIADYYTLYYMRRLLLDSFIALVSRFGSSTTRQPWQLVFCFL